METQDYILDCVVSFQWIEVLFVLSNIVFLVGPQGLQVWVVARWPVFVFMGGAMLCLLISSICHLFACCSRHAFSWAWQIDYGGIAILIVTSFYPPVYYGFMCRPVWRMFYLMMVSLLGGYLEFKQLTTDLSLPCGSRVRSYMRSPESGTMQTQTMYVALALQFVHLVAEVDYGQFL